MSLYVLFNSVLLVASLTCLISFSCALGVIIAKKISDGGMPKIIFHKKNLSQKDIENTAFHEAGHTVVGRLLLKNQIVSKVEICDTDRTSALGLTHFRRISQDDDLNEIRNNIACDFGGYVIEKQKFGSPSSGCRVDLAHASSKAQNLVLLYGMSDQIGPISFTDSDGGVDIFLLGDELANQASSEIQRIFRETLNIAEETLSQNEELVNIVAQELIKKHTLTESDLDKIFRQYKS